MTKITVFGAAGRMGGSIIRNMAGTPGIELAGAVEAPQSPAIGRDAALAAGLPEPCGVVISADAETAVAKCDVAVDFTFHEAVPGHASLAKTLGKAFLVGTTALTPEERAAALSVGETAPVLIASNMSVGVNLLAELVRRAAAVLGDGFDAEVVEMHHRLKKDAPSGTAISLAAAVAEGRGQSLAAVRRDGRSGLVGERPAGEIGLHARRGGDVVGDHDVIFASDGEMLRLSHRATSRDCLSRGAIRAAMWLAGRSAGVYTMADTLGL